MPSSIDRGAILASSLLLAFFSAVNLFVWGDQDGLIWGFPFSAYQTVWIWIALIAGHMAAAHFCESRASLCVAYLISIWWVANISATQILNEIHYRGISDSGDILMILGLPLSPIALDFLVYPVVDLAYLAFVWAIVRHGAAPLSAWVVVFAGYLILNLIGHAGHAFYLAFGGDPEFIAARYDWYMSIVFTLMLLTQLGGALINAGFVWTHHRADLYRDIRGEHGVFARR